MKAYALQLKMLVLELGDLELEKISLILLKDYLARVSERLKPSSLGHLRKDISRGISSSKIRYQDALLVAAKAVG